MFKDLSRSIKNLFWADLRRGLNLLNSDSVVVISTEPPFKDRLSTLTTVPLKPLSNQQ